MSVRIFGAIVALLAAAAAAVDITSMPGFNGPLPSRMYSGYETVYAPSNRRLFYFFVESFSNPATDPLVLWLNGGPGCSSLAAVFTEHGPFKMDFDRPGVGLKLNPWTWAKSANVIYLESPAGVGFSSSNVSTEYTTGDQQTADDSWAFLQAFFRSYPQFQGRDFYVSGESYAGHYVPELSYHILRMNGLMPAGSVRINLRGLLAGNPWTDPAAEAFGVVQNWWDRGIMARDTYKTIQSTCAYQDITYWIINNVSMSAFPLPKAQREQRWANALRQMPRWGLPRTPLRDQCIAALKEASMVQFGGVNILGVYLDVCNKGTKGNIPDQPNYCADGELTDYLNRPDVWRTFGISQPVPGGKWSACSEVVSYNFKDTTTSVLPLYQYMVQNGDLKILVFSGDNDAIVPFTGTRMWLEKLGRPIVKDTHQWFADTNGPQVAGWATQYDRLTFTTVRDAGHMVPFMQPQRAYEMFARFLRDGTL